MTASARPERHFSGLHVVRARDETPRLRTLSLQESGGTPGRPGPIGASYTVPGQYIVVRAAGNLAYLALTDAPGGELSILVTDAGPVSHEVRALGPGDVLETSAAEGAGFALGGTIGRPLLLLATRTGIAPLRAVIRDHMLVPGRWPSMTLLWGAQTVDEFPYRDEWSDWTDAGVRITPILSRPGATGDHLAQGRVQDVLARSGPAVLGGAPGDVAALVVGMPDMVRACREVLHGLGVANDRILTNH